MKPLPRLHGLGVALVTPFLADGTIDWATLEKLVAFHAENKTDYLVIQGTTGESATLRNHEKTALFEFIKSHNPTNIPLVFGIGGNVTTRVVETIKETDLSGVMAVLSVCPYYNKPGKAGLIAHYSAIADASSVPVVMYNIPGRTGINMSASTTIELSKHQNIIGIKEASCIIEQCMEIMRDKDDDFLLISGDDVQALPIIALGGVGVMSVVGNAFPKQFGEMVRACLRGDFPAANKAIHQFIDIDPLLYEEGNPVGVKGILETLGVCSADVRLPLTRISADLQARQKAVLLKDKLFKVSAV